MRHALRNLIAFVFLGGIFWFVFRDVGNLSDPRFQLSVGFLVTVFAVFWLAVPCLVVRLRIRRRNARNARDYEKWLVARQADEGRTKVRRSRLPLEPGESELFHEKGTLYVPDGTEFDAISQKGRIGEVAFPKERRAWRRIQRVHFYLTNRRVFFLGKELDYRRRFETLGWRTSPGGVVFEDQPPVEVVCFTVSNPLILAEFLRQVMPDAHRRNRA